ncbi:glycosyltransferase family 2 protein [Sediminicola luteus]|uniref:Glycosyltransferase 2-like domain-containing protein n=1 Tax=Sediminicola luteus TaxID=319238 RepID=A0A2A4G4C5_9FLAO|nr:glycosyltransferase [Sediminicola luteus]PCE62602.1 hypothetical protein B7P33_18390 [Sediminicola luteus]
MVRLAILLTCFNRKTKTLKALAKVKEAQKNTKEKIALKIFLTDDGSSDGTSEAVKKEFPYVTILQGDGDLFWAGGMRMAWKYAANEPFDAYLLLNDDTDIFGTLFDSFLQTHQYSKTKFGQGGIYIGATQNPQTKKMTYGGATITNRFLFKYTHLIPNDSYQSCHLGNANIMFVSNNVVDKIGILSEQYIHGVADYDYTLRAYKNKLPVLLMPGYLGNCINDHRDIYASFADKSIAQRWKLLKSPIGLDFKSNLNFNMAHFPLRVPMVLFSAGLKLIFPKLYISLSNAR